MSQAKYYVYWNLHKKMFSVKYRGKVIGHYRELYGLNCEFKVSESGRQRVLREKRKNVHAYVVCSFLFTNPIGYCEVGVAKYNPYTNKNFMLYLINGSEWTEPKSIDHAEVVHFEIGEESNKPILGYGYLPRKSPVVQLES